MKKYLCSMGAWVVLMALTAAGQTSSSGSSQGTSDGTQGANSSSQGNSQGNVPTSGRQSESRPGSQNQQQRSQGFAGQTNAVSNFGATNQPGRSSAGTAAGTNSQGLFPTGRAGETNRTFGTNSGQRGSSSYGTNTGSSGTQRGSFGANTRESGTRHQDEAVTQSDRTLLVTVRQKVQTEVRAITSTAGAWAPVNFRIDNGVVTIFGTVQTIEIKQQIEDCVRRVPGVIRIENTIEIAGGGGVGVGESDQVLLTRVRGTVLPQIQVSGIDFQCHGGVITVMGIVPQEEVRQQLVNLVRQVPGVVNVTDQVAVNAEVQGQAESGRFESGERPSGQVQPGQGQATQVQPGPAVETTRTFGTGDRGGQGKVEDEAVTETDRTLLVSVRQKVLAEVRGLKNIATEGAWAPALHFRVVNGVVTIIGAIPTIELKRVAEDCVRRVPGVVRVEDTIEVGGTVGGGDSDLVLVGRVRQTVLPQIQVSGIDFQCHDGVVTVIGTVPQPEVKERLVTLVRQVPGVVNVTDQVTVNGEFKGQTEPGRFESGERRSGQAPTGQAGQVQPGGVQSGQTRSSQVDSNQAVNAAVETSRTNLAPTGRTNALPPTGGTNSLPTQPQP